jgi:hypothetical protein
MEQHNEPATPATPTATPPEHKPRTLRRVRLGNDVAFRMCADQGDTELLDRVANAESIADIAESIGVSANALLHYLKRDVASRAAYESARRNSAEAWSDRATRTVESGLECKTMAAIQARRHLAAEYVRRAALVDRSYSERSQLDVVATVAAAVTHIYLPDNGRARVIDGETLDKTALLQRSDSTELPADR